MVAAMGKAMWQGHAMAEWKDTRARNLGGGEAPSVWPKKPDPDLPKKPDPDLPKTLRCHHCGGKNHQDADTCKSCGAPF
jgi:hypothetical protein